MFILIYCYSKCKAPGPCILIIYIDIVDLVSLMQELHVLVEAHKSDLLDRHLHVKIIAFLKEDRRAVNRDPIVDWNDSNVVFEDLGLDVVRGVVVDRVTHVLWQDTPEALLVQLVVIEDFKHHHEVSGGLRGIEPDFEYFVLILVLGVFDVVV